jgi:hypothetical protein
MRSDLESMGIFGSIPRKEYKNPHRVLYHGFSFVSYRAIEHGQVIDRVIFESWINPSWIPSRIKNAELLPE